MMHYIEDHGFVVDWDRVENGEICAAACCYAGAAHALGVFENGAELVAAVVPVEWPWARDYWRPAECIGGNLLIARALLDMEFGRRSSAKIDLELRGGGVA